MKKIITIDLGDETTPAKMILSGYGKNQVNIISAVKLNSSGGVSARDKLGITKEHLKLLSKRKTQLLIIIPDSESKSLLYSTSRVMKEKHIPKWIQNTLIAENELFFMTGLIPINL